MLVLLGLGVPVVDKKVIKSLIDDKPHYPYLFRHEFASEYAPKMSRLSFNQLMGHSENSEMQGVYVQSLVNDNHHSLPYSIEIVLQQTIEGIQKLLNPQHGNSRAAEETATAVITINLATQKHFELKIKTLQQDVLKNEVVSNLSRFKASIYFHYRRTILKELIGSGPVGIWIKIHLNPIPEIRVILEKAEQCLFNDCFCYSGNPLIFRQYK